MRVEKRKLFVFETTTNPPSRGVAGRLSVDDVRDVRAVIVVVLARSLARSLGVRVVVVVVAAVAPSRTRGGRRRAPSCRASLPGPERTNLL